jgi:hypothetical protein
MRKNFIFFSISAPHAQPPASWIFLTTTHMSDCEFGLWRFLNRAEKDAAVAGVRHPGVVVVVQDGEGDEPLVRLLHVVRLVIAVLVVGRQS